jgi:hypothetical protein
MIPRFLRAIPVLTASILQGLSQPPSSIVTYRWTVFFGFALLVLLFLWLKFIFRRRLSVLAGTVTVDGRSLPKFCLRVRHEESGRVVWECARDFSDGYYVIYDVPQGALTLDLSWGTNNSCQTSGTLTNSKQRTFVDFEISLDVEISAVRNESAGAVTAEVKCIFKAPTTDPPLAAPLTTSMKYAYTVSHVDTRPAPGMGTGPLPETPQEWSGPKARSWQSTFTTVSYTAPRAQELWTVEVCVDGAPDIKKKSKALL